MRKPRKATRRVVAVLLAVTALASGGATAFPATTAMAASATASAATDVDPFHYPWRGDNPRHTDGHGYYRASCVSFAAWAIRSDSLPRSASPDFLGDARAWKAPRTTTTSPRVGDVAQWAAHHAGAGAQGHVAYVTAVHKDGTVQVHEYNWRGSFNNHQPNRLNVRTIPVSEPTRYLRF
ncbi:MULTISPECIES: CHAP domain-containing protein [Streptomyces]|uniref:CHAP domain-containing protein n=1 Tax=Streptomyces TaxID=1883 RepID=UPI000311D416|nr:CHAP domain-containing protein [Streptomyces sp. AA0539]